MIHRNDERVFRVLEVTCYLAGALFWLASPLIRKHLAAYFIPLVFVVLSASGLMFIARFFIYEEPEDVSKRKRTEVVSIPSRKKWALAMGLLMCVPMLVLGICGLFDLRMMEVAISRISPFRFLLVHGAESATAFFAVVLAGAVTLGIGIFWKIRSLIRVGVTVMGLGAVAIVVLN